MEKKVGDNEADRIMKQSTEIGTAVHEAIEKFLGNNDWDHFQDTSDQIMARKMTSKFVDLGLKQNLTSLGIRSRFNFRQFICWYRRLCWYL